MKAILLSFLLSLFSLSINAQSAYQRVDSLTGEGWSRMLYTTTTVVDTIQKTDKILVWSQTETKDARRIFVDPRIGNFSLYADILLDKKDQIQTNSSLDFIVKSFRIYRENTITKERCFWSGDSIKLIVTRDKEMESATEMMVLIAIISILSFIMSTIRNFLGIVSYKKIRIISVVVSLLFAFSVGFFARWEFCFGTLILCFIAFFYLISINQDGAVTNGEQVFAMVVASAFGALLFLAVGLCLMVCLFFWFCFCYFLGYLLAKIIIRIFLKNIKVDI